MYNDLQRARTTWNYLYWPEKPYNEQETTWKWPTTSKKQPKTTHKYNATYNDLNKPTTSKEMMQINHQQADFEIILQYGTIGSLL